MTEGLETSGLGELERRALLAWVGENLTQVRRSVYEQRILHWSLGIGFMVGLAAACRWLRAQIVGDDEAARTGRRPALCARLGALDRCRRGRVRPDLSRGETAAAQGGAGCLRGSAARPGPTRIGVDLGPVMARRPRRRLVPVVVECFRGGGGGSEQQRRLDRVRIPPVRLRLGLGVQVDQVLPEVLRVGGEVRAVRTGFAFGHLGLLPRTG